MGNPIFCNRSAYGYPLRVDEWLSLRPRRHLQVSRDTNGRQWEIAQHSNSSSEPLANVELLGRKRGPGEIYILRPDATIITAGTGNCYDCTAGASVACCGEAAKFPPLSSKAVSSLG